MSLRVIFRLEIQGSGSSFLSSIFDAWECGGWSVDWSGVGGGGGSTWNDGILPTYLPYALHHKVITFPVHIHTPKDSHILNFVIRNS